MAIFPGAWLPWVELRFFLEDGSPNAGGFLYSFEAGTSTPQNLYTDALLTVPAANPVTLGADGRPTTPLYMLPTGYRFVVQDQFGTPLTGYGIDDVVEWNAFTSTLGNIQAGGAKNVTSGYTILATDFLVTVFSTGGPNPCVVNLPQAATAAAQNLLTIKNVGTIPLAITPNGSDTLEGVAGAYTVPAANGVGALNAVLPSVLLAGDHVSAWFILSSHKVP